MISRYEVKEISQIWTDENRFKTFLKVEIALLKALESKNFIPHGTHVAFQNLKIDPVRIAEIEETTRHDIIAFCSSLTEQVDSSIGRYFHFGVTSSDIIDTALSLQLKESLEIISGDLKVLCKELELKIQETSKILCMGRSHGMFAEPMIFAQKFLSFHQELQRRYKDYQLVIADELTGQFSGAVGNYTVLDPEIEKIALSELGLKAENVSTQIIPRDHIAKVISTGALLASTLERMATEFRLLHHSDVKEVAEGFKKGQKGSSTMPHKKNPISSENISGLARVLRSHVDIALQNEVLWHERDISHSSAERIYLPDHFGLLSYALRRMSSTVRDLVINQDHIEKKTFQNPTALSSYLLHEMILLNSNSREELYALLQDISFRTSSYQEFTNELISECLKRNIKTPKVLSVEDLKFLYIKKFNEVLKRSGL